MTSGLERYKDLSKLTQSSVQTQDSVPLALYFSHACRSCWKKGLRCSCGYGVWVYFLQGESRSLSPILGLLSWKPSHSPSSLSLVTAKIDKVARIDYSLVVSPIATADSLDLPLKVRITLLPQTQGSSLASKTNLQGLGPLSASPCSSLPTSSHPGLPAISDLPCVCPGQGFTRSLCSGSSPCSSPLLPSGLCSDRCSPETPVRTSDHTWPAQ